jgi:peptidyl-prolyl cis-trans isomerase A (cyclophilin A)
MSLTKKRSGFFMASVLVLMALVPVGLSAAATGKSNLGNPAKMVEKAPAVFQVRFTTTKGIFVVEVTREWAPLGADRFYNLVKNGYYDNCRFFRVIAGFMAQFGIHGDPKISAVWEGASIKDDPVRQSNLRGFVSFATAGPNTRTTQLFINYADRNSRLDSMGFSPFGKVVKGLEIVDSLYSDYGEGAPRGGGPDQGMIRKQGNGYLEKGFAKLDYIKSAVIVPLPKK